jgi:hypothetical protein
MSDPGWLDRPEMLNIAPNRNGSKLRNYDAQPHGLTGLNEVGML